MSMDMPLSKQDQQILDAIRRADTNRFSFLDILGSVTTLDIPEEHTCEEAACVLTKRSGIPHKVLTMSDQVRVVR